MPKQTFFNLSEDKQQTVLRAAYKEFSTHSIHEALVSNIVKESHISRGSFYKYFNNIEDLYVYLYQQTTKEAHKLILAALDAEKGNLFKGLETYLSQLSERYSQSEFKSYYEVLTLNSNHEISERLSQVDPSFVGTTMASFTERIDFTLLNITDKQALMDFLKVLTPLIHQCLVDYFVNKWDTAQLLTHYRRRVKWLKYGVLKNEMEK